MSFATGAFSSFLVGGTARPTKSGEGTKGRRIGLDTMYHSGPGEELRLDSTVKLLQTTWMPGLEFWLGRGVSEIEWTELKGHSSCPCG